MFILTFKRRQSIILHRGCNIFTEGEKMVNVEAEINKHKNCKDRGELGRFIQEYKNLALKFANNFVVAGQYNLVALRLQEISDKLPGPPLKNPSGNTSSVPVKTATITKEEDVQINAAWKQRAGGANVKR